MPRSFFNSPFVLLVSLASAFFWVTVFMVNSIAWRIFCFIVLDRVSESACRTTLVQSVLVLTFFCVEEMLRPLVVRYTNKGIATLERRALSLGHPNLTHLEKLRIFLGIGAGQGIAHSCLFFLNLVVVSYKGTYYNPQGQCPQMPYFLVTAISSSASFVVLSFAMVIASLVFVFVEESSDSSPTRDVEQSIGMAMLTDKRYRKLVPFSMHAAVVAISFMNLVKGGCLFSTVLNIGAIAGAFYITWKIAIVPKLTQNRRHAYDSLSD